MDVQRRTGSREASVKPDPAKRERDKRASSEAAGYTDEDGTQIAKRLADLGYIE